MYTRTLVYRVYQRACERTIVSWVHYKNSRETFACLYRGNRGRPTPRRRRDITHIQAHAYAYAKTASPFCSRRVQRWLVINGRTEGIYLFFLSANKNKNEIIIEKLLPSSGPGPQANRLLIITSFATRKG